MNLLPFVPKGTAYHDEAEKTSEERNGVILAEMILDRALGWKSESIRTPDLICEAQLLSVNQIYRCAGYMRDDAIALEGTGVTHKPPAHTEVKPLVELMCAYVNDNWKAKSAIHLSSYMMWRINWIHPFFGGNGRTARAISYLVLSAKLGFEIPGDKTIPELIVENRDPYYVGLRKADAACERGVIDVSAIEDLMECLLADQLMQVHDLATGRT